MHAYTDQSAGTEAGMLARHDGREVPIINIKRTKAGVAQNIRELS
jgi:hypothetical protein